MHKGIGVFVEGHQQTGEVHLTRHLEIEEIAIHLDTTLHQVVVDDRSIETFHEIRPTAVTIQCAVKA